MNGTFDNTDSGIREYGSYSITINKLSNTFTVTATLTTVAVSSPIGEGSSLFVSFNPTSGSVGWWDANNYGIIIEGSLPYDLYIGQSYTVSNSVTFNFNGDGTTGGTIYLDKDVYRTNPIILKSSTTQIKLNGAWKNCWVWHKINGAWKRCIVWKKISGTWEKGI